MRGKILGVGARGNVYIRRRRPCPGFPTVTTIKLRPTPPRRVLGFAALTPSTPSSGPPFRLEFARPSNVRPRRPVRSHDGTR